MHCLSSLRVQYMFIIVLPELLYYYKKNTNKLGLTSHFIHTLINVDLHHYGIYRFCSTFLVFADYSIICPEVNGYKQRPLLYI